MAVEKARAERLERQNLPGARGEIYDRHGEALVQNQHVVDLIADHVHLTDTHVCRRAVAYAEGLRVRQVADMFPADRKAGEIGTMDLIMKDGVIYKNTL